MSFEDGMNICFLFSWVETVTDGYFLSLRVWPRPRMKATDVFRVIWELGSLLRNIFFHEFQDIMRSGEYWPKDVGFCTPLWIYLWTSRHPWPTLTPLWASAITILVLVSHCLILLKKIQRKQHDNCRIYAFDLCSGSFVFCISAPT